MRYKFVFFISLFFLPAGFVMAQSEGLKPAMDLETLRSTDSDGDGLKDYDEIYIYNTSAYNPDTDDDWYFDGQEVNNHYDPNKNGDDKLQKNIVVTLADQSLSYKLGDYVLGTFKISSGLRHTPTPLGEFSVLKKKPVVDYIGVDYRYPKTKWNLMFKLGRGGNFYIHGAYWHKNFGRPMSHGCVNVAYDNMETLYNWAEEGTKITIK